MKLLLTADLHCRIHWFRWLIEEAPNFDLVCIAGDLLDIFKFETRTEQSREIAKLIRELAHWACLNKNADLWGARIVCRLMTHRAILRDCRAVAHGF
jgi:Icc-related predicted phosphoesterase